MSMRHKVKKVKSKQGKDAKKMLLRKLAYNFLMKGKITITCAKAKDLKSFLERIISRLKRTKPSARNFFLRKLGNESLVRYLINDLNKSIPQRSGGFLKIVQLGPRMSDGASMAKVEWAFPMVVNDISAKDQKPKTKTSK